MIFFDQFLRSYGVRQPSDLIKPKLRRIELLQLPKQSILHYLDDTSIGNGPSNDEYILRNNTRPVYLGNVTRLTVTKGNPRLRVPNANDMINKFFSKHRRYVRLRDLNLATRDQSTVLMYNYNMLQHLYTYMRTAYSHYYQWYDVWATMFMNVNELANQTDRHQFIMLRLPDLLPKVTELNFAEQQGSNINQSIVRTFNTPERRFILELWKFLGEHPEQSMLNAIDKKNYSRVNFIYQESGRWTFINLGLLMSWKTSTKAEIEKAKDNPQLQSELVTKGFRPQMLQKTYLRSLMSIMQVRSVNAEEEVVEELVDNDGVVVNPAPKVVVQEVEEVPTKAGSIVTNEVNLKNPPLKQDDASQPSDTLPEESLGEVEALPSDNIAVSEQSLQDLDRVFKIDDDVQRHVDDDLSQLELMTQVIDENEVNEASPTPVREIIDASVDVPLDEAFMKVVTRIAENGLLTAQDYARLKTQSEAYKTMPVPEDIAGNFSGTMEHFVKVPTELLDISTPPKLPDIPTVVDKSMLESSLIDFDSKYVKHVMQRDIASMVFSMQKAGVAIKEYDVEKVENISGAFHHYSVKVQPVEGVQSTLRFRIPVVNEEGVYRVNDVSYSLRKQRGEKPIYKVDQNRVALVSYYGKIFVDRSDKKVNDFGSWVRNQVRAKGLNPADNTITNIHPANVFDSRFPAPRAYSIMANGFADITVTPSYVPEGGVFDSYMLNFDQTKREKLYGKEALERYERSGQILIGTSMKGAYVTVDEHGSVYRTDADGEAKPMMSMEQLLSLDATKAPIDFVELRYLGRSVPLVIVLAYEMGLTKLMSLLGARYRKVPVGTRVVLTTNEFPIVFNDTTLIFNRDDGLSTLILAGLREYANIIREYDYHEFDKKGVYFNIFDKHGLTVRYLREIDLMYQMYIDPITLDLLKEMHEPLEFRPLLIRAAELLTTDHYPDVEFREKGYERMAGAVYGQIINSIRSHSGRPGKAKHGIEMNPHEVWKIISTDPSKQQLSQINPIQNLKEKEAATFSGVGGRSSRSMVKRTRLYRPNDKGVISESTVDSGSVGINVYLSANPRFKSLRGLSKGYYDPERDGVTSLLSTSALLAPGSDRDDPKRVNFVAIQNSHGVACEGYHQMPVRTGYESVVAHRTGDMYAATAKKPGKVISIDKNGIIVEYDDGERIGVELGRRFGDAAGLIIPHDITTFLKVGDVLKPGDVIAYNAGFFERDVLNPSNVVLKNMMLVRTVLLEAPITFEDSSAISKKVADKMATNITKMKEIVVSFDQEVHKLVREKQTVEADDILCIVEDQTTAMSELFDEESLNTLSILGKQTPQAKVKGTVDRIEVYYNGEIEDMSDTLRKIAIESDRGFAQRFKASNKTVFTGQVDEEFRVDGNPLLMDTMVIRLYITSRVGTGVGDKGVFSNQMKTVIGEINERPITTESGVEIDAIFGQKSIDDRIVTNPAVIGTTAVLLEVAAKRVVAAYRS